MSKMQISIELRMPEPRKLEASSEKPVEKKKSPEQVIEECLECVESGNDSHKEWATINKIYKKLTESKKPTERAQRLIDKIRPVLEHYGYYETTSNNYSEKKKNQDRNQK